MQEALPYKSWNLFPTNSTTVVETADSPVRHSVRLATYNRDVTIPVSISGSECSNLNKSSSLMNQTNNPKGNFKNMVTENAVIVFGRRGCCMSHVIKCLLQRVGANPVIYDIEEKYENEVVKELEDIDKNIDSDRMDDRSVALPAVFIGGELFGGLDRIMAAHISGELCPILKKAGALWL